VLKISGVVVLLSVVVLLADPASAVKVEPVGTASVYGQPDPNLMAPGAGAMTARSDGLGYWIATTEGVVVGFGQADHYGDMKGTALNQPIVGMVATSTNQGYWLVASDGGIFSFGDAVFYGSTGALTLNSPIVGMAATNSGFGYWLVAADGGVFSYGDARFYGSTGAIKLNRPIVAMLSTKTSAGYWLMADDGGIFTFGDAHFHGSGPGRGFSESFAGMIPTLDGSGYALVHSNGTITPFGSSSLSKSSACDPWPVTDMSIAGEGAVVLRSPSPVPSGEPSRSSAEIDAHYLKSLISHSQSCQSDVFLQPMSLLAPLAEPVTTSSYGWRRHPIWGEISKHNGIDFIGPNRTSGGAALSVRSGTVMAVIDLVAYGTTVVVDHGGQVATVYGHLKESLVVTGAEVEQGDPLGWVGSTGLSTGAHLHFELRLQSEAVDPGPYLLLR
tara:strand:+ start:57776 stop:59104 length:1329 start_codon:yes stop_codon:yes gene_type:complete